jgi:hypothetical protein
MKLTEIFRFEIGYQVRRFSTWLYAVVLVGLLLRIATEGYVGIARAGGFHFNSPFIIASLTLVGSMMGLLTTAALAGDAGARDVATRMHPLVYTAPVSKTAYLGGRFLAAFTLNALILAALPLALWLATLAPGIEPELLARFRPASYLGAYFFFALPNAFIATAFLFSAAVLSRRAMASYLGAVVLFFGAMLSWEFLARELGFWALGKLIDPLGLTAMSALSMSWTAAQKNALLIPMEGSLLVNRLLWMGIALGVLALTHLRFCFAHHAPGGGWSARRGAQPAAAQSAPIAVPRIRATRGAATRAGQTAAIAWESYRDIVTSWGGLALAGLGMILVMLGPQSMEHLGVPLFPTTAMIVDSLAAPLSNPQDVIWMIVPLLLVFYAGELVWREREAGLGEIADAAPVPEWVRFAGKLAGLGLVLVTFEALMMAVGMFVQAMLGYYDFEIGLYLRTLFGLHLADYLLFALLALVVHVVVDHKFIGHGVALIAYGLMAFAPAMGVEHNLLVFGSGPGWEYSDMRGFGASLGPWLWFKLYWAAWALLLAVAAKLLWVRGRERGPGWRLQLARRRFTRPAASAAAAAMALILALGGFVFYNTNVLNPYETAADWTADQVAYERRYGRFAGVPQPRLTGVRLHVELHPSRGTAEIHGSYRLLNATGAPIDSIHVAADRDVETGAIRFDRPARRVLADTRLGYGIYVLARPLQPGDSLRLGFDVRYRRRGFTNSGSDASVVANGTFFEPPKWLPAIGYQSARELNGAGERRLHGLPPRPAIRPLTDTAALREVDGRIAFEAVVGTNHGQLALAPGALRRTWTKGGRRYFHYAADVPIRNDYAIFSARYAVKQARWTPAAGAGQPVDIQIVHHPGHAWNPDRMIRGVRASLDYFTREFGPYPHRQMRLIEYPTPGNSLHGAPVNIWYKEEFSLFRPDEDPRRIDFPFAVTAHEVAHQWWGNQLEPASVEGGPVLTESLSWYSAFGVVEKTYGPEHLRRLLAMMREMYLSPRARAGVPLMRASDTFLAYRKGPFAMYALREYVGEAQVNAALRTLLRKHSATTPPLPTTLDLYRELRAVTPDSLHYLLTDLFEANTYWELATKRATAEPAASGGWRVTMDVQARKVVVDTAGAETEVPMNDLVQIGVFARGAPLYLRMHRIRAGRQRITVIVPRQPALAGIDPRNLLIDATTGDNTAEVKRGAAGS